MKAFNKFFTGLFLSALITIVSCENNNNSETLALHGNLVMNVTENNNQNSGGNTISNVDTTFNSLFKGLKYIPDNSEWNFMNDSVQLISRSGKSHGISEMVFYKITNSGNAIIIHSQNEELVYPLRIVDSNQIELDFGDPSVTYRLIRSK